MSAKWKRLTDPRILKVAGIAPPFGNHQEADCKVQAPRPGDGPRTAPQADYPFPMPRQSKSQDRAQEGQGGSRRGQVWAFG